MKIGIVAHEARARQAFNLFNRVGADFIHVDSAVNPIGCAANHRHVWNALCDITTDEDEWLMVMEDDAVPCRTFREQARWALAAAPEDVDVVSFYLGQMRPTAWQDFVRQAVAQADSERACWITSDTTLHAVCIAIRNKDLAGRMLKLTENVARPPDERISFWCRQFGHKSAYSHPSLVDHRDEDSVIPGRGRHPQERGRVAWSFGMTRDYWTARSVALRP